MTTQSGPWTSGFWADNEVSRTVRPRAVSNRLQRRSQRTSTVIRQDQRLEDTSNSRKGLVSPAPS